MITDEPVRGSYAYVEKPGLFGLSGLDQLRLFTEGRAPGPPIHHLAGLVVVDAREGASTWSMPASPWWRSATGLFPGGALAFVADAALGGAIYTVQPARTSVVTSELSLDFVRPATPSSRTLSATGRVVHVGRRQALSEARIEDAAGALLAHATSRCLVQPVPFDPPELPASWSTLPVADPADPDPYQRPPQGEVLPQAEWDRAGGLELMQRWVAGELRLPPICHLLGWRPLEVDQGAAAWTMPASEWFCTGYATFYGGAVGLLADGAIGTAITTTIPAGAAFGTLDLKVNFLRPVTADGRDLVARGTVVHRGRRIVVATATVEDADGKRLAMATGSAMILPARPWSTVSRDDLAPNGHED
ncbi:MAG TPA: PaaI family thioesterase [Actinomycetota bacterium]|nr:PaaI family thioesterase [Actinomycetota bacterium]